MFVFRIERLFVFYDYFLQLLDVGSSESTESLGKCVTLSR